MKKFLFSNKIYLPILAVSIMAIFYGAYFVEANYAHSESKGRVLGVSEEIADRNFLPLAQDVQEDYWNEFISLKNFPQKLKNGTKPVLNSGSYFVYNPASEYVFMEKDSKNVQAIASITKLMTALVFLDLNPGWESIYEIKREDRAEGGRIYLYLGDKVRIFDLFNLSLTASGNTETMALVNSTGKTKDEFVKKMNEKALSLGLLDTSFVDPTGLSHLNVSTARDLAVLVELAVSNDDIRNALQKEDYSFMTVDGVIKNAYSTDELLSVYPKDKINLLGGKTGFIDAAGYCFAGVFEDNEGKLVVSVVLGTNSPSARFEETDKAVSWIYSNFIW